jgi:hypothetical protein
MEVVIMSRMKDYLIYLEEKYPDKENEELIEKQNIKIEQEILSNDFAYQSCRLTFSNGLTISIVYGNGLYCSNRHSEEQILESKNVEIAVFDKDNNFFTRKFCKDAIVSDFAVSGWISIDRLADIIYKVKNFKEVNYLEKGDEE